MVGDDTMQAGMMKQRAHVGAGYLRASVDGKEGCQRFY